MSPLSHIPVLVLTARDPSTSRDRALAAGAAAFLEKPIDADALLTAIRDAIGEPATP